MECNYCKNMFNTKSSLNTHQKTAKYCLKLRNIKIVNYKCDRCNKSFSTYTNLNRHQQICQVGDTIMEQKNEIESLKKEINEYKIKLAEKDNQLTDHKLIIEKLQDKLGDVAIKAVSRSTTTNNNKTNITNYIQQLQPITEQHLTDNVQHLTIEHILKGPEGYAQYALEFPLKDRMICVDYARRKVKFKDKDGNVITDPDMANLATKFFNSIKDKNKELIIECSDKLKVNFGDEIDTIVKIFDYKSGVDNGSDGTKTEFQDDFVKSICGQTLKD